MIINSINIKSMKSMKHSDYHGKLLRLAMVFVALFLCGTMAYAQTDRMISGIVVDENGDPLPAAHIRQVSQTKGEELAAVITDMNGHFRLTLLRTAKEIEISYLGYESKKVRLTSANSYRIILEPASELLDEVVVTGYQTISRERATGSFAKVDSKKLETQRLSSVSSLMEGRIAGYSDGKIRGVTSMNGLTTPLYVIDGFPVEKTISDGLGNWVENVPDLNIEDIENITVLKDAAATSIYGARAANGVVVITTKKAGKNQLNVSFSATLTVRPYNFYTGHLAGTANMIEMEKEWAAMNPNLQGEGASQYAQNMLDNASMYSCLGPDAIRELDPDADDRGDPLHGCIQHVPVENLRKTRKDSSEERYRCSCDHILLNSSLRPCRSDRGGHGTFLSAVHEAHERRDGSQKLASCGRGRGAET